MDIAISHLLTAVDHVDTAALTTALAQTALGLVGVRTGIGADYIAGFAQMERNKDGQVTLEQIQDAIDAVHDVVEARDGCRCVESTVYRYCNVHPICPLEDADGMHRPLF